MKPLFNGLKTFWTNYTWSRKAGEGRLFLLKWVINWVVSISLRFIPEHDPVGYGVAMWKYTFNRLENVARIELENDTSNRRRDENFINLLQLLHRLGSYLGTKDPFYRLWLAFFFKQSQKAWLGCKEDYLPQIRENLKDLGPEYDDFKLDLLGKAFELRTCGGLHLIEELEGDNLNTLGRASDAS